MLWQDCHSVQNEQVFHQLLCVLYCIYSDAVVFLEGANVLVRWKWLLQWILCPLYEVCSTQTHIPPGPFRGIVEETPNTTEHGRPSVMLEKYASATKMQPQSSGSLRSNAGIEKGKEIAARLNIHRIHSQLRGLDSTGQSGIKAPVFLLFVLDKRRKKGAFSEHVA